MMELIQWPEQAEQTELADMEKQIQEINRLEFYVAVNMLMRKTYNKRKGKINDNK